MAVPPNFTETLRLIKTLNGLPTTGCKQSCGYTVTEIQEAHNGFFPATPLTLEDADALLRLGTRRGVFRHGGCVNGTVTAESCNHVQTELNHVDNQTFFVNTAMHVVNTQNQHYVNVGAPAFSCPLPIYDDALYQGLRATGANVPGGGVGSSRLNTNATATVGAYSVSSTGFSTCTTAVASQPS